MSTLMNARLAVCACLLLFVLARSQDIIATRPPETAPVAPLCAEPCYVVQDYWPQRDCTPSCDPEICDRGWGAWESKDLCCTPGLGFSDGCSPSLSECWVAESTVTRTCARDDRKCLQGSGVYGSNEICCIPSIAFPLGCANVTRSVEPCWVVDTYYPSKLCRPSTTLCGPDAGQPSWLSQSQCCLAGSAFPEGCNAAPPPVPCWKVDTYYPKRLCKEDADIAVCNRGWGVYPNREVCCAKNVAFPEGCSEVGASVPLDITIPASMPINVTIPDSVPVGVAIPDIPACMDACMSTQAAVLQGNATTWSG